MNSIFNMIVDFLEDYCAASDYRTWSKTETPKKESSNKKQTKKISFKKQLQLKGLLKDIKVKHTQL